MKKLVWEITAIDESGSTEKYQKLTKELAKVIGDFLPGNIHLAEIGLGIVNEDEDEDEDEDKDCKCMGCAKDREEEKANEDKGSKMLALEYNPKKNIVTIHAKESDLDPKFLTYLLEHKKIPRNAKRVFTGSALH